MQRMLRIWSSLERRTQPPSIENTMEPLDKNQLGTEGYSILPMEVIPAQR